MDRVESDLLKDIKLSIIIPVFNGEKYISTIIDKILQIDLKKEVIVINDGSTDNSLQLLQNYSDKIILINLKENHGVAYARNCGLEKATGDYITFMDQDDDFELDMHSKILTKMLQTGSDVGMCNYDIIEANGKVRKNLIDLDDLEKRNFKQEDVIKLYLLHRLMDSIWTSIYRAPLAKKINFCEKLKISEDSLYQLRISFNAKKTCFVNESMYHYIQHTTSSSHDLSIEQLLLEYQKILSEINNYITTEEKEMLNNSFEELFEFYQLSWIVFMNNLVSRQAKNKKQAKALLRKILNPDIIKRIIKNKYTPWYIKFEFIILKTFGISFHLFFFQFYRFLRRIFMPGGIQ